LLFDAVSVQALAPKGGLMVGIPAATVVMALLQASAPGAPAEPLSLPAPSEELPPLTGSSLVLTDRNEPDPLVAREREGRRSERDRQPRGETVIQRPRRAYDPLGVKLGGFTLFPSVTVGAGATSNVVDGEADVFASYSAAAVVRSDWSRHQLVFDGHVDGRRYLDHESEDSTSWLARARGRLDIQGTDSLVGEVSTQRVIETRGTVGELVGTRSPVRYTRQRAELAADFDFGRLTAGAHFGFDQQNFDDSRAPNGSLIEQDQRDRDRYELGGEVGYQFGGPQRAFLGINHEWQRYRLEAIPRRDVNVLELLLGIRSEITPLIRGQLAIGYLRADFLDPAVRTRDGIAINTRLDWLVTELTTIHFTGRRTVSSVASATSPGAIITRFRLGADHELLRNVIVSGGLVYDTADYIESPRLDRLLGIEAGVNWLISPRWRMSIRANAFDRTSKGPGDRDYEAASLRYNVTFQL
jgi:hypothetical protein